METRDVRHLTFPEMNLSEIFGKPREGIHSTRIFGLAAVDLGLTVVAAVIIVKWGWCGGKKGWGEVVGVFAALMCMAVAIHYLFGVKTALNEKLGL